MNQKSNFYYILLAVFLFSIGKSAHAVFPITVIFGDGELSSEHLSQMSASSSQVLQYNGTSWGPVDFDDLFYMGTWNASTNIPSLSGSGNAGEYYIVSTAGNTDLSGGIGTDSWAEGDWVLWNDVLARWEKISNSGTVQSFAGRSGNIIPMANDYTWAQVDKSVSSLNDITDVNTLGVTSGDVLKWDGTYWSPAEDINSGSSSFYASPPLHTTGGSAPIFSISVACSTDSGYITSSDWNLFNGKQDALLTGTTAQYFKGDLTLGTFSSEVLATLISGFASTAGTIDATDTILSSINKINGNIDLKENIVSKGDLSEANSNVLNITNGTGSVIGTGTSIEFIQADTNNSGYLTSIDWNTFNNKMGVENIDNTTVEVNGSNQLQIKDSSITSIKLSTTVETKSSNYTVGDTENNKIFLVNNNSTITLPAAALAGVGFQVVIKNIDNSNTVVIDGNGGETIDGNANLNLESQYSFAKLICDGSNWISLSKNGTISW